MSDLMTPLEVSKLLNIRPRSLEDWRQGRSGPSLPFVRVGKLVRYRREDVQRLIDDNTHQTPVGAQTMHAIRHQTRKENEMDPRSGELVRDINSIPEDQRHRFEIVPRNLRAEAMTALEGRDRTVVNLKEASPLAVWASRMRVKQRRNANKIAKASRRKNRK